MVDMLRKKRVTGKLNKVLAVAMALALTSAVAVMPAAASEYGADAPGGYIAELEPEYPSTKNKTYADTEDTDAMPNADDEGYNSQYGSYADVIEPAAAYMPPVSLAQLSTPTFPYIANAFFAWNSPASNYTVFAFTNSTETNPANAIRVQTNASALFNLQTGFDLPTPRGAILRVQAIAADPANNSPLSAHPAGGVGGAFLPTGNVGLILGARLLALSALQS